MERPLYFSQIQQAYATSKVVALLGPRQCGKTTLARQYFNAQLGSPEHYFDLENPRDLARLSEPLLALENLSGLIVIDEIQRSPELFPLLRFLSDQEYKQRQFLISGSASRELIKQSSESLAGRIHYIEMTPFSLNEAGDANRLWLQGGLPLSYLAKTEQESYAWREQYIRTFLEQDIPALGISIPAQQLRRFWMMLAHYHGQFVNYSELSNSLDISQHKVKHYLDILSGTFMIRQLSPWHENISKRQVKAKKIYIRDSGIFHSLLGIENNAQLITTPKIGASWEGFALETVIRCQKIDEHDAYFWATHANAELDLLIMKGQSRIGYEFKYTQSPKISKSMRIALEDLKLDQLTIIYPGEGKSYRLSDKIHAQSLQSFAEGLRS
jgi:predicted AAA+ superfamily ATPase